MRKPPVSFYHMNSAIRRGTYDVRDTGRIPIFHQGTGVGVVKKDFIEEKNLS